MHSRSSSRSSNFTLISVKPCSCSFNQASRRLIRWARISTACSQDPSCSGTNFKRIQIRKQRGRWEIRLIVENEGKERRGWRIHFDERGKPVSFTSITNLSLACQCLFHSSFFTFDFLLVTIGSYWQLLLLLIFNHGQYQFTCIDAHGLYLFCLDLFIQDKRCSKLNISRQITGYPKERCLGGRFTYSYNTMQHGTATSLFRQSTTIILITGKPALRIWFKK